MKNSLKLISLCLALAGIAVPVLKAQPADAPSQPRERGERGGPGGRGGGPNLEAMAKELDLTADQKAKLGPILKEQAKKMQELRDLSPEERREKGRALREENHKALATVLTPEQLKKFDEMRPRGGQGQRGGGEKGEKRGEKAENK
jgi:Spy/CpxP family protein refolding chaperone